jgi:hypothetical protein
MYIHLWCFSYFNNKINHCNFILVEFFEKKKSLNLFYFFLEGTVSKKSCPEIEEMKTREKNVSHSDGK